MTVLLVRERPPLTLTTQIETPSGTIARWGADDNQHVQNIPNALTFSTTAPGGFEQASLTLERDPNVSWPDLEELSTVTIRGLGGSQIAWQGRLEQQPETAGAQAQITPQLVGWQSHLSDNNGASMIYIDRAVSSWGDPSVSRQINLNGGNYQLGSSTATNDPTTGNPALQQEITDSWVAPYQPLAESWYDAGANNLIAKVGVVTKVTVPSGLTTGYQGLAIVVDAIATGGTDFTGLYNGASNGYKTATTPLRYAYVDFGDTTTPDGAQGAQYLAFWENLVVIGNHGLTIRLGPSGNSPGPDDGLLASDIIAHAVSTWAPKLTLGTIVPSIFVIPHLVFNTATTAANIVQQAAQYELLDWFVWDNFTFWCNPRGQYAGAKNWRARVGPAQLQQTGPNISRIYNGVYVSYTDAATGTSQVVGPSQSSFLLDTDPENPANQAGIDRYANVQMGTSTQAGAIQVGQTFLQEQKLLDTSGQASLVGHVMDDRGVWWPSWRVRAGDQISFMDAADNSFRRIVSTSYDDSTATNSINLDQPPDSMTALLARLSVVLSGSGLS